MYYISQTFVPQIYQTVGLIPGGNARQGSHLGPDYAILGQVTAIKRQYFYVQAGHHVLRFECETNRYAPSANEDCNSRYAIFETIEAAESAIQAGEEWAEIKQCVERVGANTIPDVIHAMYQRLYRCGIVAGVGKSAKETDKTQEKTVTAPLQFAW